LRQEGCLAHPTVDLPTGHGPVQRGQKNARDWAGFWEDLQQLLLGKWHQDFPSGIACFRVVVDGVLAHRFLNRSRAATAGHCQRRSNHGRIPHPSAAQTNRLRLKPLAMKLSVKGFF